MPGSRGLLWLERVLLMVGVLCLGYYAVVSIEAARYQREQAALFQSAGPPSPPQAGSAFAEASADRRSVGGGWSASSPRSSPDIARGQADAAGPSSTRAIRAAGRAAHYRAVAHAPKGPVFLDVPRLGLTAPVIDGDDERTLRRAAGHLTDTPHPWEPGNSAIAGHRDGLFRPLRNIRVGDVVRVRTTGGDLSYVVRDTKIVAPNDLSVLAPTTTHTLTLITCYPFNYIGPAPQRFVVHAERVAERRSIVTTQGGSMTRHLRRDIRLLQVYAGTSSLALVVLAVSAFSQPPTAQNLAELTVQRLNVTDANGTLRLVLSGKDRMHPGILDGKLIDRPRPVAGLLFFNDEGDEVGGLTITGHERDGVRRANALLAFDQLKQDQIIALAYNEAKGERSTGLTVWDRPETRLSELIDKLNAAQKLSDEAARDKAIQAARASAPPAPRRMFVGKNADRSVGVMLAGADGKPRLNLRVDADGKASIEFLDADGKVTRRIE